MKVLFRGPAKCAELLVALERKTVKEDGGRRALLLKNEGRKEGEKAVKQKKERKEEVEGRN